MVAVMRFRPLLLPTSLLFACLGPQTLPAQTTQPPHLKKQGQAIQLIVEGKPYVMLGGELHNSSSSSLAYMKPEWPRLAAMQLNTVFTPVSWELVEPTEGKYDFSLVDGLLDQAREQHLHIVFLWLGSWKNRMSSYAPVWVKQDTRRFPRVVEDGKEVEILSTFGTATRDADARAFSALMQHLKSMDGREHTVLMMQVENEVGVLGSTRDQSAVADRAFDSAVPAQLMESLRAHRETLNPELLETWQQNGEKSSGTWTQVFGDTSRADEIFMAWHYARYVQAVAAKGKAAYDLPMYVNTWLAGEDTRPGNYPSGGPQPRVVDVWKAAGTALDIYAPDLYAPNFTAWCKRYHRDGNPLLIPETRGGAAGAANVFYAVGEQAALGFSPFGIDSSMTGNDDLANSYRAIAQVAPMLLEQQTQGNVHGFVLDKDHPSVDFFMQGYTVQVSLDGVFGFHAQNGFGLIMATGPDKFLGAGKGFRVSFTPRSSSVPRVGLAAVDEGTFEDGKWVQGRQLNGDENDQGRYWRFDPSKVHIEKADLYRFQ